MIGFDFDVELYGIEYSRLVFEGYAYHIVSNGLDTRLTAGGKGIDDLFPRHMPVEDLVPDEIVAALHSEEHLVAASVVKHTDDFRCNQVGAIITDEGQADFVLIKAGKLLQPSPLPGQYIVPE